MENDVVPFEESDGDGFVYAMADGTGNVKIGWSKDPFRRLVKVRSDSAQKITLLGMIRATRQQEAEIQRLLWAYRKRGEWFHLTGAVMNFVSMLPCVPSPAQTRMRIEAEEITLHRLRTQETQQELADRLGIAPWIIARLEKTGIPYKGHPTKCKLVKEIRSGMMVN